MILDVPFATIQPRESTLTPIRRPRTVHERTEELFRTFVPAVNMSGKVPLEWEPLSTRVKETCMRFCVSLLMSTRAPLVRILDWDGDHLLVFVGLAESRLARTGCANEIDCTRGHVRSGTDRVGIRVRI